MIGEKTMRKTLAMTFTKAAIIPWVMCGLGAIYYCYEYFLRISPSVMTTELMGAYQLSGVEIGSLSAYYYHAYVPMQIIVGLLMDRYGPRHLLTVACFMCAIGTWLFAARFGLGVAEAGRFLVGLGSAFAFVGALKLATIWLPPNRFALVSGIILCLGMVGGMVGDILLRTLVDTIGWTTTLYFSAAAGVVLAVILWGVIRDTNPYHVGHIIHKMSFRELILGLWVIVRRRQIWLSGLVGLLLYLSLSAFAEMWGISYLEQARGLSRVDAASVNSMVFLGWAVGGPFWGWFSDFISVRCLPIIGASFSALLLICILLYVPGLPVSLLYLLMFLFGLFCSAQILVFAICRESSPMRVAATSIALTNMIVMVGGNAFQPLVGKLLDLEWAGTMINGARVYENFAYEVALSILPISIVIAIVLAFFIRETHGELTEDHTSHHS
jgi:sugar phosphate permease